MFTAIDDYTFRRDVRWPSLWLLCPQPENIPAACSSDTNRLVYSDPDSHPYTWDPKQFLPETGFGFCPPFFVPGEPKVQTYVFSRKTEEWCKPGMKVGDLYTVGVLTMSTLR